MNNITNEFYEVIIMRENNTMSKWGYIFEHAWWCYIAVMWYKMLFMCVPNLSYSTSKIILYTLLVLGCIYGVTSNMKIRRKNYSMAVNIIIPFGIYTLVVYFHYFKAATILVIAVAILLIALYGTLIFGRKINIISCSLIMQNCRKL